MVRGVFHAAAQAARESERAQRAYQYELARQAREKLKLHKEGMRAEAKTLTDDSKERIAKLSSMLADSTTRRSAIDLQQ
jgi:hypothetical protein